MHAPHPVWRRTATPCWHCRGFAGMVAQGTAARCVLDGSVTVRSAPVDGCAFWEREPGADDEPDWTPVAILPAHRAPARAHGVHEHHDAR